MMDLMQRNAFNEGWGEGSPAMVSFKNEEFCMKNKEFCMKNEEFCIIDEEL